MTAVDVAVDIWAVVLAVCLLSVVLFFLSWAGASVLTIARSRRRARRRPELLAELARGCAVSDLADIDDELEQVLAQEQWRQPARVHRRS